MFHTGILRPKVFAFLSAPICMIVLFTASLAGADITYYYTGNSLLPIGGAAEPSIPIRISASVTFDSSLEPNYTGREYPIKYSVTVTDTNNFNIVAFTPPFSQTTAFVDFTNGNITGWSLRVDDIVNQASQFFGSMLATSANVLSDPEDYADIETIIAGQPVVNQYINTNINIADAWSTIAPIALLSIDFNGSGGGTVTSTPPDFSINCIKGSSSGCSANYPINTSVTLTAAAGDWKYHFIGWSGGLISSDNPLTYTMDASKALKATFDLNFQAKLLPDGTPFASIQDAYSSVSSGSIITIQAQVYSFLEDLLFDNGTAVTLTGGMDSSYNPTSDYSTVKSLTVGNGSAIIGNITIN